MSNTSIAFSCPQYNLTRVSYVRLRNMGELEPCGACQIGDSPRRGRIEGHAPWRDDPFLVVYDRICSPDLCPSQHCMSGVSAVS
jgi:hypothetical protein